jgi:hypothetical protein
MVKDQRTAERVVRDYIRSSGFVMGDRERDLVDAIAGELARARREGDDTDSLAGRVGMRGRR